PEHKLRCRNERLDPGGGGINVASAIKNLGGEATALWTCGGPVGDLLKKFLDRKAIHHIPIPIANNTRENIIIYEEEADQQFRFGMPGPTISSQAQQACLDRIAGLDPAPQYLVLSGSLTPGLPDEFYGKVIQAAPESSRSALN